MITIALTSKKTNPEVLMIIMTSKLEES